MLKRTQPRTQRDMILDTLRTSDFIYFDDKRTLGRWVETLRELEREGKVTVQLNEIDEQYSRLEVRRA